MTLILLFVPHGGSGVVAPTVLTTDPAISITANEATGLGEITSNGGGTITDSGIVISESSNPTISDTKYSDIVQSGQLSARLLGLKPGTTYYIRAFATNSAGTSYGANVSFTTKVARTHKYYYYKVYDDGIYNTTWSTDVISEPSFRTTINGGPGELTVELARSFDEFGEDDDVKLNNKVECYCIDKENPNGTLIYSGYISAYAPKVDKEKETVIVTILGFVAQLQRMILRDSDGNTTVAYNSYDPANILKDVVDKYRALGGSLNYSAESVRNTNTTVSYTFNTNTIKECLDKIIELCPVGWFWRIDATGIIYLQERNAFADHRFKLGYDVERLETFRRIEDVINRVLFIGAGDPPLFRKYENTGSQDAYGIYEVKKVDQRVSLVDTAQLISERLILAQKDPEIRSRFTIVDSNGPSGKGYDIESVQVGETLLIKNLKAGVKTITLWDVAIWDVDVWDQTLTTSAADVIQILSVQYTPDSINIEASSRLPQIAKRVEDINRNLENSQTANNPVAPS